MANHRHDNPNRRNPKAPKTSPAIVDGEPISLHTGYGNGLNKLTKAARQASKADILRRAHRSLLAMPAFIRGAVDRFFRPEKVTINPMHVRVQARG